MEKLTFESVEKLKKTKSENNSKRDNGYLLSVCGSTNYRGAAYLSTLAALRSGAGLVRLCSIEKVIMSVSNNIPECVFLPLEEGKDGSIAFSEEEKIEEFLPKSDALLIGCGLSVCDDTRFFVKKLCERVKIPTVFDADALNILSECPDVLKKTKCKKIITPHYAEMARLCGVRYEEIKENPIFYAEKFAKEYDTAVVLKSYSTVISMPDGKTYINENPNAGLGKGGSGDVLAGLIASLLCQGYSAEDAVMLGVFTHSYAAKKCREKMSANYMLPSDIVKYFDI